MGILFGHDGPVYSDKNTQTRAKWQVRAMPPFSMPIFVTCLVSVAFQEQETDNAVQVLCEPAYQSITALGTSVSLGIIERH